MPANFYIEPHAGLLTQPGESQLLYKIIKQPWWPDMLEKNYLFFNRVDTYTDDTADGEQLPLDRPLNKKAHFIKAPSYKAENYYDCARSRTYSCCLSLENSDYIWKEYGKGPDPICMVFEFGKLRTVLNQMIKNSYLTFQWDEKTAAHDISFINSESIKNNPDICYQFFFINYGNALYVDRKKFQSKDSVNPIIYAYQKDNKYKEEKELRISLSAFGMGKFTYSDQVEIQFPKFLKIPFNFKNAFSDGIIKEILCSRSCRQ